MTARSGMPEALREAQALEAFLARLYTDEAERARFLAAPEAVAQQAGLAPESVRALAVIDRDGLRLAAASLAHRHDTHGGAQGAPAPLAVCWARLRRLFQRSTAG